MAQYTPIILLSSERSGTNLLRALLNTHSKIAAPPPCGVLDALANNISRYLSPLRSTHMEELIEDVITLTKTHMNPWDIEIKQQMVNERIKTASFWELFRIINEIYASEKNCSFWFSKEPSSFRYVYELKAHLEGVKFIYMVRDGRDVAASMLKGRLHAFHIYDIANRWLHEQRLCMNALSDPLLNSQVFFLKYEDLIENTETVLVRIMTFLGLDFEEAQLDFYKNKEVIKHSKKSKFWQNLAKPIDKANKGKYRDSLSTKQIQIFESIAWNEMKTLNYPLENSARKSYTSIDKLFFFLGAFFSRKYSQYSMNQDLARMRERDKAISNVINRTFEE